MKNFQSILLLLSLFLLGSCSDDSATKTITGTTTTTVEHKLVFFNSCEGTCSNYRLYKYSLTDGSISIVGDSFYNDVDYDYDKDTPVNFSYEGLLYFSADDGTNGYELWVYDPSKDEASGVNPKMLADLNSGTGNGYPAGYAVIDGKIYFGANHATSGRELWVYDPSQEPSVSNPEVVTDLINPGAADSFPSSLTAADNKLYFSAVGVGTGSELWEYDPAQPLASGTNPLLLEIEAGASSANPAWITEVSGKLYFRANKAGSGNELWMYDPSLGLTVSNPSIVDDIYAGSTGSFPQYLEALDNKLYFQALDVANGREFWEYDPAQATISGTNPRLVSNIRVGSSSSTPEDLAVYNNKLYFAANDGASGAELWIYDPISDASTLLVDIEPGTGVGSSPHRMYSFNNQLFFGAYPSNASSLMIYDDQAGVSFPTNPSINNAGITFDDDLYDMNSASYTGTMTL